MCFLHGWRERHCDVHISLGAKVNGGSSKSLQLTCKGTPGKLSYRCGSAYGWLLYVLFCAASRAAPIALAAVGIRL
jgi:hypothetical protein